MQKAGVAVGAGLIGGAGHVGFSAMNRAYNSNNNPSNSISSNTDNTSLNIDSSNIDPYSSSSKKFFLEDDDSIGYSELTNLIFSIDLIIYVCFSCYYVIYDYII